MYNIHTKTDATKQITFKLASYITDKYENQLHVTVSYILQFTVSWTADANADMICAKVIKYKVIAITIHIYVQKMEKFEIKFLLFFTSYKFS